MDNKDFLERSIGIEIELTGITRNKAAKVIAEHLEGNVKRNKILTTPTRLKHPMAGFGSGL